MMKKNKEYFLYNNIKASVIIFFLHSGHIVLLSAHIQNTTIISFCLFLLTFIMFMGILIVFMGNNTPQIFNQ